MPRISIHDSASGTSRSCGSPEPGVRRTPGGKPGASGSSGLGGLLGQLSGGLGAGGVGGLRAEDWESWWSDSNRAVKPRPADLMGETGRTNRFRPRKSSK